MKKNNNSTFYRLPARYALAFLAMAGSVSVAMADGTISMDGFSLKPGETITVPVRLNQTGDICGFQADFTFPKGVTAEAATANSESIVPGKHTFNKNLDYGTNALGEKTARIFIFSMPPTPFRTTANADAEFFYLTLTADDTFAGGDISVTGIELSTAVGTTYTQDQFEVSVAGPAKVQFSLASSELVVAEDGGPYVLELSLDNTPTVKAIEGNLSLPEGVKIKVKNEYGDYAITYGERLPEGTSFTYDASTGNFQLFAFSTENWAGNSGMLFALELEMDEKALTKTSEIKLGQFVATDGDYKSIVSEQELVVKVDNSAYIDGCYEDFLKGIDGVRKECDDAIQTITDNYKDVAETYVPQLEAVKTALDTEEQNIRQGQDANKLPTEVEPDLQAYDNKVGEILAAAKAAQSDYLYAEFDKTLAQLATDLADTKAALESYPDVKDSFAGRIAAVETAIAEVKGFIEESKAAGTNAMDLTSAKEALQAMDAELIQILADAKAAQSDIIYTAYEAKLAELKQSFEDTKAYIETYLPNVAQQYAATMEKAGQDIENFENTIKSFKAAGKLAQELKFGMADLEAIDQNMTLALTEAKAAESTYLYMEYEQKLAQLATDLADTKEALEGYADVKDNFAGRIAAVETAIAEVKGFIEESKAAGTNAMDLTSAKEALQAMDAELIQILADAKAAESDYLYAEFDKTLAQLATDLADTKAALENYPDVKDDFAKRIAAVETALAEVKGFIEESKAADTNAMDLTSAKEALQAMDAELIQILADAKAAESDYLYAAFDKALAQLATDLADTKEALNNYPDVKDNFAERMAAVETALAEVKAFIEESKAAGADASDLTSAKEALQAMDAELASILAEAKAAQSDFAYAEFDKALAQLATALADTKETLDNCPDVKDNFAKRMADVEATLAEVQAFIEESKAAGADATDLTSAKEAIQAMETELAAIQAEAKAAQNDFAYAEFDKALTQLGTALADTKETLDNCPDVKDNFAERMAAVEAALAEVQAFIEESKAAGADATDLTSAKEAIQAMETELAAIQAEAKAAQEEYTALYADYTAQVDEVQAALEETVKYIENECADVADNYKDRAEEIQAMIDAVKADVEAAKTSGNLFDFVFSVADIKVAIDEMLQAAIDEQQTVGIGLIEIDGEQPTSIYSTSGVQSDKVIKGKVNIVRMPDGTVKKIFVK